MADSTVEQFLREVGGRIGAAAVVVAVFVGVGYVNRVDLFGLSGLLGNRLVFFVTAFLAVGVVAVGWVAIRIASE